MIKLSCQHGVDYAVYKRGFTRSRDSRDAHEASERYIHVYMLEVMLVSAYHLQISAVSLSSFLGNGYALFAGKIRARDRLGVIHDLFGSSRGNYLTAVYSCTGANINYIIRGKHSLLIVLNDDDRVAYITKLFESAYKLGIVSLMKSDARLIKDIQNSHES